jgi:hypothetical protein
LVNELSDRRCSWVLDKEGEAEVQTARETEGGGADGW